MATWQEDAAAAARQAGIDPVLYTALIGQESRGRQWSAPGRVLTSPAGALGRAQLMPDTARGLGVDPLDPQQNLLGGAKYLKQQLKAFGGNVDKALAAYNAGPGAVQKYGGVPPFAETQAYVQKIRDAMRAGGGAAPASSVPAVAAPAAAQGAPVFEQGAASSAGLDALRLASQQRQPLQGSAVQAPAFAAKPVLASAVPVSGGGPVKREGIDALLAASRTTGQAAAAVAQSASPLVADAASAPAPGAPAGAGGAQAALGWAESKIGFKETGTNSGGLASYLNQRFGMANAPWCAMFTSAAVTKGGAPEEARTASVAEVRRQAESGGGGYAKGFVSAKSAQEGDLILFGNDHIGMVQRVKGGKVFYVGGNQSNGVTEASVPVGRGDIVRPKYGAR